MAWNLQAEPPKHKARIVTEVLNTDHHPRLKTHNVLEAASASIFNLWNTVHL